MRVLEIHSWSGADAAALVKCANNRKSGSTCGMHFHILIQRPARRRFLRPRLGTALYPETARPTDSKPSRMPAMPNRAGVLEKAGSALEGRLRSIVIKDGQGTGFVPLMNRFQDALSQSKSRSGDEVRSRITAALSKILSGTETSSPA